MILISAASSANAASTISVRFNGDTGANYNNYGADMNAQNTYTVFWLANLNTTSATNVPIGTMSTQVTSKVSGWLSLSGGNSSGVKMFQSSGSGDGNNAQEAKFFGGFYNSASTISSVSLFSSTGNFDAGTVFVYTSAS
jgi:hypothetical protein